jgi:two-component system chemotaxis response regulator CheB
MNNLRVLVVDDSAFNRRAIGELLSEIEGVEVVGKAGDGQEALRLVDSLRPDLVTLDLEMPRMDGFSFLRLQMVRKPVPVIVVSGYSAKENVFRALELGALDFIAKPARHASGDIQSIRDELRQKVDIVRHLSPSSLTVRQPPPPKKRGRSVGATTVRVNTVEAATAREVDHIIAVGASTGGPTAILDFMARFPSDTRAAMVIAQHMPERFTKTFAARLDRLGGFKVEEASETHRLLPGQAWLCPGGHCMEVAKSRAGWLVRVKGPDPNDRYVPSVDRLFSSVARSCGNKAIAVVLTGMGDDGAEGVREIQQAGGIVLAEARETAVIYGMPSSAVRTGAVTKSLPLHAISDYIMGQIAPR